MEVETIHLFVQFSRVLGQPRSVAEIYGLLFVSYQPLTLDDLVERLHLSKGSGSQGLKYLQDLGAVRTVYVAGDPGNILRMIRAIRKGYFVFPGSRTICKSYAYIEGLLDSFEFAMARTDRQFTYNYAERETETLEGLVRLVQAHLGKKIPAITAPLPLLVAAAAVTQVLTGGRSPVHPTRVRKATLSTHIVPETLINSGFNFRYDFAASLKDWAQKSPQDFLR